MIALFDLRAAALAATLAVSMSGPALAADSAAPAADTPPPATPAFDIGFGVKFSSDYMFRSQTQTDGKPLVQGYAEARFIDWFYAGLVMSNVSFPADPWGLSDPPLEIGYFAGVRHTWDQFSLDVGFIYFDYPGEIRPGTLGHGLPTNSMGFWEIAAKPSYAINDTITIGGVIAYSPDFVGTGAYDTYLAGTIKLNLPNPTSFKEWSWYVSGEVGYQWLGKTDFKNAYIADLDMPDFTVWNAGVGFVYKSATFDIRYWGSTLRNGPDRSCQKATSISNACGDRIVATLSFDTSLSALK